MSLSFQVSAASRMDHHDRAQDVVDELVRTRSLGSDHSWRVEARAHMKKIVAKTTSMPPPGSGIDEAHVFLGLMHASGLTDNVCVNMLMSAYKKFGRTSQVLQLLNQMRRVGMLPDVVTFNIAVDACGKAKQTQLAVDFVVEMRGMGLRPTVNTYTSLIDACGKSGDLDRADYFLHTMMTEGVPPNKCTFTTLIQASCRNMDFERALDFLRKLVQSEWEKPGQHALSMEAHLGFAGSCPNDLVQRLVADKTPYTTLIRATLDAGALDSTIGAFSLMAQDVHAHVLKPDFALIQDLMEKSFVLDRVDCASEGFYFLALWDMGPSPRQLLAFLAACERAGAAAVEPLQKVLMIVHDKNGCWHFHLQGDNQLWLMSSLFGTAVRANNVHLATLILVMCDWWNHHDLDFAAGLSDYTVLLLVQACIEQGLHDCAFRVLDSLQRLRKPPTKALFEVLLVPCAGQCTVLLERLHRRGVMDALDEDSFSSLLELCTERGQLGAAVSLLHHLAQLGLRPNARVAHALLSACMAMGDVCTYARVHALLSSMFPQLSSMFPGVDLLVSPLAAAKTSRHQTTASWPLNADGLRPTVVLQAHIAEMRPLQSVTMCTTNELVDLHPCWCGVPATEETKESPVSITTPPSASWGAGECSLPGPMIDVFASERAPSPPTVPDFEYFIAQGEAACSQTGHAKATAEDELAELSMALARMAQEQATGIARAETSWWSEA